jgi:ABC-2 type transport system permease protein
MYLAAYVQFWRINLLTMLEYRANFLMWFGFSVVYHGTAIAALYVTLRTFPSMNGWDFRQMAFLYGLWMLGHAFHNTFFITVGDVPTFVREGKFDRFLVRPLDTLFQALTVPQQIWPDELLLAIIFFSFATVYSGVSVNLGFLCYVPLVMLGGALIDFGINLAIATASFWFIRIDTLRWVVMSLEQDFTRYPISIYTRGVRFVLTFILPFAFMNYLPATFLLHKTQTGLALSPEVGLLTPLVGAVCAAGAYAFWRVGLNHYQGTGS